MDGRDFLIWQRGGSAASADSVSNFELLSLDSGYSHSLYLTNGTSTVQEDVDGRDFLVWQRQTGVSNTSGESAVKKEQVTSKGFGFVTFGTDAAGNNGLFGLTLADSLEEDPDDFTTSSIQILDPAAGEASQTVKSRDNSGNFAEATHVVQQSGGEAAAISSLRTLVTTQAMLNETRLDSSGSKWLLQAEDNIIARAGKRLTKAQIITELAGSSSSNEFSDDDNNTIVQSQATATSSKLFVGGLSWDGVSGTDGVELHAQNGRKTIRAHDFVTSASDTGSSFEFAAAGDEASLILSSGDVGEDGDIEFLAGATGSALSLKNNGAGSNGAQLNIDDTSMTFHMYENVIDKSQVQKIVMKQTPAAGSRLYVGNLGFSTGDGFHVNADLVGGTKVGVNTGTPSAALDVNGSVEIGNGTPIVQVLSGATALDFPSTAGGSTSDLSMTIVGVAVGDVVSLGVPSGSVVPSSTFTAWVSGVNVVTVRFANMATFSQNPASGTFRAMITKF